MPAVVVVGAGLTGLTAGLRCAQAGTDVLVLEAAGRPGGKVRTASFAGLRVEEGADAFLARVPEALGLAAELGLRVIKPLTSTALLHSRGQLRPLVAGGLMGIPSGIGQARATGAFTGLQLLRLGLGLELPGPVRTGDAGVGEVLRRRLGGVVVDELVEPLLGGVYAGRVDDLSWQAAMPQLGPVLAARRWGPALRGLRRSGGPVLASVDGGLGGLVLAAANELQASGGEVRTGVAVRGLRRDGGAWVVLTSAGEVRAQAVVLAVPAPALGVLLSDLSPAAAAQLAAQEQASVALVLQAHRRAEVHLPVGVSGLLMPAGSRRTVKAVSFMSEKWEHLSRSDLVVTRTSVGRAGLPIEGRSDGDLLEAVRADLSEVLGLRASPVESRVVRWAGALPQYRPGHLEQVAQVRAAVDRDAPGVLLAGAALDGVGLPACVRSGAAAAVRALEILNG